jgi:glycosyltransferase involved in cell wall biosynthesis
MYRGNTVGVVVPAYNEEGFVGEVIDTMPTYVDRVYVVDDGSTDGTWAEIETHAARANRERAGSPRADGGVGFDRRVVPIRHEENRGVGNSIKTGYLHAREDRLDVTAVMGGDGQMDPEMLDRILDPVVEGEADYAKGNRLRCREYRQGMSRWRLFGNTLLTFLTRVASGYWRMMDPQNGYTAISLAALDRLSIEEMYGYYGYCNDLLVKLNAAGMRVADVGMPAVYGDEESSISYRSYIPKVSWMLLRNFLWRLKMRRRRGTHPVVPFYLLGTGTGLAGAAGSGWLVADRLVGGTGLSSPVPTATLVLLLVGAVSLLSAVAVDRRANEDRVLRRD